MKQTLLAYAFLSLILIAVMSVLSYGTGGGYVYVLWHGVQIQTNLWVVLLLAMVLGLCLQIGWLVFRRDLSRRKRKLAQVLDFNHLHAYEQMGVIWMLDGKEEQQGFIQQVFDRSALLKQVVRSELLSRQHQFAEALNLLEESPAAVFELAEIQRIEISLAQNDARQAFTHLEFLQGHELSPWLNRLNVTYLQRLNELWGRFAVQFPWKYLYSTQSDQLEISACQAWLTQLLGQFEQADVEDLQRLQQRYIECAEQIELLPFEIRVLWLKVLTRLPEMATQHQQLALQLLQQQFDQDVFYLWFQQQLLKQRPDYDVVEQQINQFELQYPGIPVFTFAKWHIYMATQRSSLADQLLSMYPDNILMSYLRIKSTFHENEELIQQLNMVFEKDANFIQFKI
ncbi:heme biosynthesis protein HemY [Acinetobacter sp. WZC-1]|uniref:heme biosynthesis protein HemY n=1 Tax=Acinetobacter sp. WZC-1 TaxID=3459034 RepID=UPI00403E1124